jgi:hypothetical protein
MNPLILSRLLARLVARLGVLRSNAPELGAEAEAAMIVNIEAVRAAGKTPAETEQAAVNVLDEYEAKLPQLHECQAARIRAHDQTVNAMNVQDQFPRARAVARSNRKNAADLVADVENSGFRLRLTDDGRLEIAPACL